MIAKKEKQRFLTRVLNDTTVNRPSIHSLAHWKRVEPNGLFLCQFNNANTSLIQYFAYLHDCQRLNDGHDPEHGQRAATYTQSIREYISLNEDDFSCLLYCCRFHTTGRIADNDNIANCWDAVQSTLVGEADARKRAARDKPASSHPQLAKARRHVA